MLFGETGSGQSSIINLLADRPVADVAIGMEVCTKRSEWYQISLGGKRFRLWDTMGFSAEMDSLSPYEQAYSVLRNLGDGVDLILLCARHDRINASLRSLYWLLDSFFFCGRAKIALVITKLDEIDDGWWDRNKDNIAHSCNIPVHSLPHACITTIQNIPIGFDSNRDQSKHALEALLENHVTTRTSLDHLHLSTDAAYEAAVKSLKAHCPLSRRDATTLVERFKPPTRPFHAVLLGEHGAGKSSIINLIAGSPVAETTGEFYTCTLNCRSYEVNTGSHQFLVWDTMGLNGPFQHKPSESAIESVARLICNLRRRGDLDLLVFCKEFNWTPPWELQIFRLFKEIICESKIPVAFIITHLENLDPMEEWWEKNGDALLGTLDMEKEAVAGHACITSTSDEKTSQDKLSLSRQLVHAMLETSVSHSSSVSNEEGVRDGSPPMWEKVTVENLTEYCGLTKEVAEELCEMFHLPER